MSLLRRRLYNYEVLSSCDEGDMCLSVRWRHGWLMRLLTGQPCGEPIEYRGSGTVWYYWNGDEWERADTTEEATLAAVWELERWPIAIEQMKRGLQRA